MIKDSGERRTFESGAVRDIQADKGACWMLPLDEIADFIDQMSLYHPDFYICLILADIACFIRTREAKHIHHAIGVFCAIHDWSIASMLLELSKHFEEGAEKYDAFNWCLGIKAHCYVDSSIRHLLKWADGQTDEPHDRAFVWNLFCLLWTVHNRPECDDLGDIKTIV